MPITVDADYELNIIKALQKIIPSCTFILGGRNGVEPKSAYCLVSIITEMPQGKPQRTNTTKVDPLTLEGYQTVSQDYAINYTMTFHGLSNSQSEEWCRYLGIALESDFVTDILYEQGMSVLNYTSFPRAVINVNNTTNYINDTIDIVILTNRSEQFPVGYINRVEIDGTYNFTEFQFDNGDVELDSGIKIENFIKRKIIING